MLSLEQTVTGLEARFDGALVLGYVDGKAGRKPYLHPLALPGGPALTEDAPEDHRHHHGAWFAHHLVQAGDGTWDFYLERGNPREGRQLQQGYDRLVTSGERVGFRTTHEWLSPTGRQVARATWDLRIAADEATGGPLIVIDWAIMLAASDATFTLQPTNESAMPLVRPAPGLTPRGTGLMVNSRGQRNESETFGRPAEWIDCSGEIDGARCGLALLDHPHNPGAPQPWFTRNYGPFGPHSSYFAEPLVIPPWRPLFLRYRLLLHFGDATEADVQGRWQDYAAAVAFGEVLDHQRLT
ncbi:MAG: PmoA family protein [Chloroflexi bacterium]|nr:PmoA family protein [Chloroflexota bacterium]